MELGLLRVFGPLALAVAAALWVDRSISRRGLQPPGFRAGDEIVSWAPIVRRSLALTALTGAFAIGVFAPLGLIGLSASGPVELETPQLFHLHILFCLALAAWYLLGFAGAGGREATGVLSAWRSQFGLRRGGVLKELVIGAGAGLCAWLSVLVVLFLAALVISELGGEEFLPQSPPPTVTWIAALPFAVRLGISLSAGVVEELFFRGFLQPRVGIALSSGAFVLAHLSYEQPIMLFGITLLSLIFAALVQWRQSIWAAMAAHTVFDAVQLLVVIPRLLDLLQPEVVEAALFGLPGS